MLNLNQTEIDISSLKEKVLSYLLNEQQKLGLIKSDSEYNKQYEKLHGLITANNLTMEYTEQPLGGLTDIVYHNNLLQQIYMDLLTTFEQMNAVSSTIDKHRKLNNSIISNLKTKISSMEDEITILEDKMKNATNRHIHVENFRSTDSFETNPLLYTDANGDIVSDSYRVTFDKYNECVALPKLVCLNKLISTNGQKMAKVVINKQLGDGLINLKNPNNAIEKAIDTDIESYWEETILADTPIKVELDATRYYKIGFGAVCEIEVVFTNMSEINEIALKVFGQFPLEIVAIKVYQTDQPDDEETKILNGEDEIRTSIRDIEILSPYTDEDRIKTQFIHDTISIQFPSVHAKRLRIILNQQHYIKNSFIYNKDDNDKNDIWFNSSNDVKFNFSTPNKSVYNDKLLRDKSWILFNKAVQSNGQLDLEEILFPKNAKLVPVTKYEYNYGLYNLAINENNYKTTGIYISKPISLDSNIASVTLVPDTVIPYENVDGMYKIQYFISTSLNPTGRDWIMLDKDMRIDFRELLDSGKMSTNVSKERFFGTKGTSIELSSTPYMDFDTMNIPTKITIIDADGNTKTESTVINTVDSAGIATSEFAIKNVTDLYNPNTSYKNFTNTNNCIEYYFYKNKIYFNTSLSKNYIIEVDYKHFINSIRVKAILSRNDNSNSGMTPILNGYKLLFDTIA